MRRCVELLVSVRLACMGFLLAERWLSRTLPYFRRSLPAASQLAPLPWGRNSTKKKVEMPLKRWRLR